MSGLALFRGKKDAYAVFDTELQGGYRVPRLVLSGIDDLDIPRSHTLR